MSFEEEVRLAEGMAEEFGLREKKPELEVAPGEDLAASIGRMRLWLKEFPEARSVAGQIGSLAKYRSPGWPFGLYAMDRRDVLAVLDAAEKGMGK